MCSSRVQFSIIDPGLGEGLIGDHPDLAFLASIQVSIQKEEINDASDPRKYVQYWVFVYPQSSLSDLDRDHGLIRMTNRAC